MQPMTVTASDASGGAVASGLVRFDDWAPGTVSLQVKVTGTVNYTVQTSMDDPNSPTDPVAMASVKWMNSSDANVVAATATQQSSYSFVPMFIRVVLNSGTGSISATVRQSGVNPI